MDDILERIVSLVEKKENGDFAHGAKKKFCDSIGVPQQTFSDWLGGRSSTYIDKLYEIASVYHVSVAWLKTGKSEDEEWEADRQQWLEEQEALQILRDSPETRTLLMASKKLKPSQIKQFTELMKSIPEG